MREVKREEGFKLQHEGQTWTLDISEWRDEKGAGELRVHRVEGNKTTPLLVEALKREADSRGISLEDPPEIPM